MNKFIRAAMADKERIVLKKRMKENMIKKK